MRPVLQVEHLVKHFAVAGSDEPLQAVSDLLFSVERAETLGIIGESKEDLEKLQSGVASCAP